MSLDDYTGIKDTAKQHPLDLIRNNLEKIPQSMRDQDIVDEIVSDITLNDIYHYIMQIKNNQDLPLSNLKITYASITNLEIFSQICDYRLISNFRYPSSREQRVYFIESSDFATTLIPIELDNGTLNIFMEPLESSPDFITQIWAEINTPAVKTDLALKNPWELKPRKKANT